MKYTVRPGVVLTDICGAKLLIPDREASHYCSEPMGLGLMGAIMWEFLTTDTPMDKIYLCYSILSKKKPEEVREKVDGFLAELCERGFLIAGEEE